MHPPNRLSNFYFIFILTSILGLFVSAGPINKCIRFYEDTTLASDLLRTDSFFSRLEELSEKQGGYRPKWIDRLADDPAEFLAVQGLVEKLVNSPHQSNLRALTARLYKYRIGTALLEYASNPKAGLDYLSTIPENVLADKFNRNLDTYLVKEVLGEMGIVVNNRRRDIIFRTLRVNSRRLFNSVAVLSSVSSVLMGSLSGILLPKVSFINEEQLFKEFGPQVTKTDYKTTISALNIKKIRRMRYEILYSAVQKITLATALVGAATTVTSFASKEYETMKAHAEEVKVAQQISDTLTRTTVLGTPKEEANKLLAEFIEKQKSTGESVSESDSKAMKLLFEQSFEKQAALKREKENQR